MNNRYIWGCKSERTRDPSECNCDGLGCIHCEAEEAKANRRFRERGEALNDTVAAIEWGGINYP